MPTSVRGTAINRNNEGKSAILSAYSADGAIADNIKTRNPIYDALMPRKKIITGGSEIAIRFRATSKADLGENLHTNAYRGYDQLTVAPSDTIKEGSEGWCNLQEPIAISHEEQDENSGKYKAFDLVKEKTIETEDHIANQMNAIAWGVAGGDQSLLASSIPSIVSGSDAGTIHGLSKASNTWLYSQETNTIGDAATEFLGKLTTAYNLTIDNAPSKSDKLDVVFMARPVYEVVQNILPAYIEYGDNKNVDIGIPKVVYMGMKLMFDSMIPADSDGNYQAFGLMLKYWELAIKSQKNFLTTKFYDMLPDQAADVAQLFVSYAHICRQPRTNWRGKGITV